MTMTKPISDQDREFCQIYGEQSREFFGNVPWEFTVPQLQEGWMRVRGRSDLEWADAEPHVRAGWDNVSRSGR